MWGAVVMWECSGNVGCSGDVWVQRGCGVMYEAMVMWEWSGDVGAVGMWGDVWGDSGCSVEVG